MKVHRQTVSDLLWKTLLKLMRLKELSAFRLVGGTSLSLLLGHRISVDIDLFTDAEYGSIDFHEIDRLLQKEFKYVDFSFEGNDSFGKSYFIGTNKTESIKVDLFYTDSFEYPEIDYKEIRLSGLEEIVAMKLEVIGHNGRKKDFWDIHELLEHFSWNEMFSFYEHKYPYGYTKKELIVKLTDFEYANSDLEPICLKGKYWELVKLDIEESIREIIS